jgi:hypothetical protein
MENIYINYVMPLINIFINYMITVTTVPLILLLFSVFFKDSIQKYFMPEEMTRNDFIEYKKAHLIIYIRCNHSLLYLCLLLCLFMALFITLIIYGVYVAYSNKIPSHPVNYDAIFKFTALLISICFATVFAMFVFMIMILEITRGRHEMEQSDLELIEAYVNSKQNIIQGQIQIESTELDEMIIEKFQYLFNGGNFKTQTIEEWKTKNQKKQVQVDDICSICRDDILTTESLVDFIGCDHQGCFHHDCLIKWTKICQRCPLCNALIEVNKSVI